MRERVQQPVPRQRQPRRGATVVRIEDGEAGLSARSIKRRLASVTGPFEYLIVCGVVGKNPVPHGLSTGSPNWGGRFPLIRTPRTSSTDRVFVALKG